ncbi:hypothetical protein SEUCBS139899_008864 [Sporothrix eucalyptigena]|uniref:Uncharacterized protein n=1 Tax=Sporothrix eucalyptigena TaxID=1812306 RepID=A0ABP0ARR8_9PEZI
MSSHAALSAAVDDRKARLAKLRSIKRKQPDGEVVPPESDRASPAVGNFDDSKDMQEAVERDVSRLYLSGRNYDPETRGARLGFESQPNLAAGGNTLEAKASKLEAEVRRHQEEEEGTGDGDEGGDAQAGGSKPIDLFKLQPKKPNWDLKRELNKRLEPLNARTDNAISRLVRERLAAKQQQRRGANPVTATSEATATAAGPSSRTTGGDAGDESGMDGAALVESIRLREQEAEEEERRERELDDEDAE